MANPIVQQINVELESLQKELGQFKSTVDYLNGAKNAVIEAVDSAKHSENHFEKKVNELKETYYAFIALNEEIANLQVKLENVNFPERLDSIQQTVKEIITNLNETRKATLIELQNASKIITHADFEGKFKNLELLIVKSVESSDRLTQYISKLKLAEKIEGLEKSVNEQLNSSFNKVEKNTRQIATETTNSILNLNLPIRIDKLDANVAGIMAAIQSVQSRLDGIERNITDRLNGLSDYQKETKADLLSVFDKSTVEIKELMNSKAKKHQINTYITWVLIILGVLSYVFLIKR